MRGPLWFSLALSLDGTIGEDGMVPRICGVCRTRGHSKKGRDSHRDPVLAFFFDCCPAGLVGSAEKGYLITRVALLRA